MELLTWRPSEATQRQYTSTFFGTNKAQMHQTWFGTYFAHHERELAEYHNAHYWPQGHKSRRTHAELQEIFVQVRQDSRASRREIRKRVLLQLPSLEENEVDQLIDLSVRVGYMLNVRNQNHNFQAPEPALSWPETQSVGEWVADLFPVSKWKLSAKESRLHPSFTATFMVKICGLELLWSNCLADHLYLDRKHKTLHIFPHKSCIEAIYSNTDWGKVNGMQGDKIVPATIPRRVLQETIMSLNLLFPPWDQETRKLLLREKQTFHEYGSPEGPKTLSLMEFDHWRDRLLELNDAVFSSPPASWRQLLLDKRDPHRYWTFMIAFAVLVLTVVGTCASIVQAVGT